jgi:hypothetical protein
MMVLGRLCTSGDVAVPSACCCCCPEQLESVVPGARGIESDGRTSWYAASSGNGGGGSSAAGFCSGGECTASACSLPAGLSDALFLL